jgi:hypothetical protein
MNAAEVRERLERRWPNNGHLIVHEAPMNADRSGQRIDMLVLGLWASRGYEIEAVEIKVSVGDWRREQKNPGKADFWVRHTDRFWIAAPSEVAKKIQHEIPPAWGLISVGESQNRVLIEAPRRTDREPLPWAATVGVLRSAADAGTNALARAHRDGVTEGKKSVTVTTATDAEVTRLRKIEREHKNLLQAMSEYAAASGVDLTKRPYQAQDLGFVVGLVNRFDTNPRRVMHGVNNNIEQLRRSLEAFESFLKIIEGETDFDGSITMWPCENYLDAAQPYPYDDPALRNGMCDNCGWPMVSHRAGTFPSMSKKGNQ